MRSKAPLALMEQMIMLLVFALAAAVCLQAFVKSGDISRRIEERDQAALLCQTAAETIRHYGGDGASALSQAAGDLGADYSQGLLWLDYDGDWTPLPAGDCGMERPAPCYRLTAQGVPSDVPGLEKAEVSVVIGGGAGQTPDALFTIEIAWQDETPGVSQDDGQAERETAAQIALDAAQVISRCGGEVRNALSQAAQALGAEYSEEFVTFSLDYDQNWNPLPHSGPDSYYRLCVCGGSSDPGDIDQRLTRPSRADEPIDSCAEITVITGNGSADQMRIPLSTVDVSWETEVSANG